MQGGLLSHSNVPPEKLAGVDEAGRGCLAGPVVAAAVILPGRCRLPGLDDSKKLSPEQRLALAPAIKAKAVSWALGLAWPGEIDRVNILNATLAAMERALAKLRVRPEFALIDGNKTCPSPVPQRAVVGGDGTVRAISAASVLAKTFRDRLMEVMDRRHPRYGLAGHKGYGTREHLEALAEHGPCPLHRLTFRGVAPEPEEEKQAWLPGI